MTEKKVKTNMEILDSWQEYMDAAKEDMLHNKTTAMDTTEICDRCGEFLFLVLKDDGDIKYFCPKDRVSVSWEAIALRGLK